MTPNPVETSLPESRDTPQNADLAAARAGSREALGRALESCRQYLLLIANEEIDPRVVSKEAASDMVQTTFLDAHRDFAQFAGTDDKALRAWLRSILLHNILSVVRGYRQTEKRDAQREISLDSQTFRQLPADSTQAPSPSQQLLSGEQLEHLTQAIAKLPSDYQTVIRLRNQEDLPFEEIAVRLQRSVNAVRKLWFRAIQELQVMLASKDQSN